ncbi:hypothetical protein Aperf_G00000011321 [Anoplocephala perfoliata]
MSQLPANNDYSQENYYGGNTVNTIFSDASEIYSYHQAERYVEPIVPPVPQRLYQTDDGVNYSSSLFSDSILQTYDSTIDDPIQMSHSFNPTHFSDNVQPFEGYQTDYTVYELSTPGGFNNTAIHCMDQSAEVNAYPDASISQSQNSNFVNYPDYNMNYAENQTPLNSANRINDTYTYSPMQTNPPVCSYNGYDPTMPGTRYVCEPHVDYHPHINNQEPVYQHVGDFSQQSYSYSYQYSSSQQTAPVAYSQPNCYANPQSAFFYYHPETQDVYREFQPCDYHQNRGNHYIDNHADPVQPIWPEHYCFSRNSNWTSHGPNNYVNYKDGSNQAQFYKGNHFYSQQQSQAFNFPENYPPNVQTDSQIIHTLSKPVQATESTAKASDPKLPQTDPDNRLNQESEEEEEEEETVPSPSQAGSLCEPVHEYVCSHCNKHFVRPSHLEIHFRTHTGERPFRCCICSKSFSQASNLQRHMLSHKTWPQLRSIGGKMFSANPIVRPSRSIMPVARRIHLTSTSTLHNYSLVDSQFECRFCGLRVKGFQKIRSHMTQHNNEKVYQCIVSSCLKTFTELGAYIEHLNSAHDLTDSKWLRCNKCLRQFESVSDLLGHYTSKRAGTSHCSLRKSASNAIAKKYLNSSQNRQQTSTQLRCPICRNRRFARYGLLRLHLLNEHAASSVSEVSSLKAARIQNLSRTLISKPQVQPAVSTSQETLPTANSEPSQSVGDTSNGGISLETSDSNPSPPPLRLTNVHLIVERRNTAKRISRQHPDVPPLACPLCGRVFRKKKFFDDHCTLCQQKQAETERRQRWRENRRQSDNTEISESLLPDSQASPITESLDNASRRTRRSRGNIQLARHPIPAS